MKILTLHCDYIKFKPVQKALKNFELEKVEMKEKKVDECLVVLTAVEAQDSVSSAGELVKNIKDIASQVRAKNIVLYPYAHLSSNLSSPGIAEQVLKEAEKLLKADKEKFSVTRAPFGYYKEFELRCKGHPLSELSREIGKTKEIVKVSAIVAKDEVYDAKKLLGEISKTRLDTSKLKENDHRIIGQKMDLFSFSETAPGMTFWHNNGLIIYNELVNFWREEHRKAGYQEISTPIILDKKLWQISGHWEKYKENIFLTKYEGKDYAVKPMNCPGGMLVYKTRPRSYKEFPLKVAELGTVHRQELSGVLAGLFRVIKITQDDAHLYCMENQLEEEIIKIVKFIDKFYNKFGFSYHLELSTRPEKRIGTDAQWDKAEKVLETVLKKMKKDFKINKGDGAFYGPKIDFHIKDSLGRTWQCATIQLDFAMPERFELEYTGDDNKKHRPVMLHRTVYGSLERFIGVLLEHLNGNLPVWLSPIQVEILSFTDRNDDAVNKLQKELLDLGIRSEADLNSSTVSDKIRNAEIRKIPYIIVLGDKEEKSKTLAVRRRAQKPEFGIKPEKFVSDLLDEIKERK